MKVLLLGDGKHDRGDETGRAGAPTPRSKWGALQFLVERALVDGGAGEVEFILPIPTAVALRVGRSRQTLPPEQIFRSW